MRVLICIFLLITGISSASAQELAVTVLDASSRQAVPFAAIRLGASGQGVIADLYGYAVLPAAIPDGFIEITALGYEPKRISGRPDRLILLQPKKESLSEVVFRPDEDRLRRIIQTTVSRRDRHNPERYDWYRCHVYYKMVADAYPRDPGFKQDTSADARDFERFIERQHLLLSETYSIRTWKRPQRLQEEVIGSRFSGFKKSMITGLVTDILPFHAYTDYLKLNGKDFRNPVSRGSGQWYRFNLRDEILRGADTLWIISYFPKKAAADALRGTVYISSGDYAITHFVGSYTDSSLGNSVRIEQQYRNLAGKWFPEQLNYVFHLMQKERKDGIGITMQGSSRIDSVTFDEIPGFRFDKVHTVKLTPAADHLPDSAWSALRPDTLNSKESKTYVFMDSLMESVHFDRLLPYVEKLAEGKFPLGPADLNLDRLYAYNNYEGSRFGIGLQSSDKLSRHFSIGAWGGYGVHDRTWKYGGFGEVYLDSYKETAILVGYERDLRDPGRTGLHRELDRNYLRNYLMNRADMCDIYSLSFRKRFGYFQAELSLRHEDVVPKYTYAWQYEGAHAGTYTADEATLNLRYAFAERSAPLFGKYLSTGSKYPVFFLKATHGLIDIGARRISYTQALAAIAWQKHIAGIGTERWLLKGGRSFSDAPLPIGKLFGGSGVRHDSYHLFIFGGLQTIYPYTYFSDAFLSWSWRHEFDWKLYRARIGGGFSSLPGISLVYNGLVGTMRRPEVHQGFAFQVPDKGYHEGGIVMSNLLRAEYMNLYYIGLGAGYFVPLNELRNTGAGTYVLHASVSL